MRQFSWKAVGEFVGIGAIVASLIFVGIEMRQQQEIAAATHHQERAFKSIDYYFSIMQIDSELGRRAQRQSIIDTSRLVGYDREYLESLTPKERVQSHMIGIINIFIWDNLFYQYQSGFISAATWQADRSRFRKSLANTSYIRYEIDHNEKGYRTDFIELAKKLIAENERGE